MTRGEQEGLRGAMWGKILVDFCWEGGFLEIYRCTKREKGGKKPLEKGAGKRSKEVKSLRSGGGLKGG